MKSKKLSTFIFPCITNCIKDVVYYFIFYFRIFYLQLFTIICEKCGCNFFHVYLSFDQINCPCCTQEYCRYCIEIKSDHNIVNNGQERNQIRSRIRPHDKLRCIQRYTIIYIPALMVFLIFYLKFVFVCNSNLITRYLTVTFFILEYIIFTDKVDNMINTFLSIKNITLGILLLIYYEEKDILIYLIVGMIQLMTILLINLVNDILRQKIHQIKESQIIKVLGKIF